MWWMIVVVLLIEWLVGLISRYTMGGFIHVLLVVAIAVAVIGTYQDRKRSSRQGSFKRRASATKGMNVESFGTELKGWRFF
ncbi:MAG: lmo0937 family membrane protein [Desulfobacteraceae bacterium]|nr:MAG: lmo0937 family membrane protein [Desulfobacteraceae bacterium]